MKKSSLLLAATVVLASHTFLRATENSSNGATPTVLAEAAKPPAKPYPIDTCIVSDDKLGEMGKPVVFEYKGQEIKLCCKSCRKDFDKDPAKFLKKLEPKK